MCSDWERGSPKRSSSIATAQATASAPATKKGLISIDPRAAHDLVSHYVHLSANLSFASDYDDSLSGLDDCLSVNDDSSIVSLASVPSLSNSVDGCINDLADCASVTSLPSLHFSESDSGASSANDDNSVGGSAPHAAVVPVGDPSEWDPDPPVLPSAWLLSEGWSSDSSALTAALDCKIVFLASILFSSPAFVDNSLDSSCPVSYMMAVPYCACGQLACLCDYHGLPDCLRPFALSVYPHPSPECVGYYKIFGRESKRIMLGESPVAPGQSGVLVDASRPVSHTRTGLRPRIEVQLLVEPIPIGGIGAGILVIYRGFVRFLPRLCALSYFSRDAKASLISLGTLQ